MNLPILADDASAVRVDVNKLTLMALQPVWVPYKDGEKPEETPKRGGRKHTGGPNGEPVDSGKWRLQLHDGRIYDGPTLSTSAVDTAAECMHKWALSRLDDLPRPENHKAALGNLRHDELEAWLKYGVAPTTPGMSKVIEHFPHPGMCESESYFGFVFGRPGHEIVFAGYLDARESVVTADGLLRGKPQNEYVIEPDGTITYPAGTLEKTQRFNSVIRDLKTTGSFDWKKTPAQLRANLQACLYALGEMARIEFAYLRAGFPLQVARDASEFVILKWTYALLKEDKKTQKCSITRVETVCDVNGSTKDPQAARGVILTREQALTTVATYLPVAERMLAAIEAGKKAKDVEKNHYACADYGGCGWKKPKEDGTVFCDVPVGGGFLSHMKQERLKLGMTEEEATGKAKIETKSIGLKKFLTGRTEKKVPEQVEKKSMASLGSRFGNKSAQTPAATAPKVAPETKPKEPAAASSGALGGRFAKKAEQTAETASAESKVEVKAKVDGIASTAKSSAPAPTGTLAARLSKIANPDAVEESIRNAAVNKVGAAAMVAVGINPPDVAPEWTLEQQAAEAERIAGTPEGKKAKGKKAAPALEAAQSLPSGAFGPKEALTFLDDIAAKLMKNGHRVHAAKLLTVIDEFTKL